MTFRGRLVGVVTAVTVVTLGGAFVAVYVVVNRSQERQLDEALVAEAHEEAQEAAALGGARLAISARPGPMANDVGPLTKYGAIYGADGAVRAATPTFRGTPPPLQAVAAGECFDLRVGGEYLRAVVVDLPAHPGSRLLLAAPRADLDGDEAFLGRAMLVVFLAAVLWAVAVASWVVERLTRGHRAIADAARRVAGGDLQARVHVPSGDREVVQLASDVNEMIDRLASLLKSQNEFIAHAAHELRSPLTTLYGELSHATRKTRDPEEYRASIEDALDSARRLKTLAEDLLTLARLDAGSEEPKEPIALAEVLEEATRAVAGEAEKSGVTIRVEGSCRWVPGRARELERLFRNLVENAVRHSPRETAVRIQLTDESDGVTVNVIDQGPGVPAGERERIFEPFYRGARAQSDDPPGAGLGLAIARRIARAHGGEVALGPDHGLGAAFTVRLPV